MKLTLALFAAVIVLLLAVPYVRAQARHKAPAISPLDRPAMLRAIRQKESGDRPEAIGSRGERTAYQFIRSTWCIYTTAPHELAGADPVHADRVAAAHLAFCVRQLERRGLPVEPLFVAAAWRHGPWFALQYVRSDYAREVANLYADFTAPAARP